MDIGDAFSMVCQAMCPFWGEDEDCGCGPGGCTLDWVYSFPVKEPTSEELEKVLKKEFNWGKKHKIHTCQEWCNRSYDEFRSFYLQHKKLEKFWNMHRENKVPEHGIDSDDPWFIREKEIDDELKAFILKEMEK